MGYRPGGPNLAIAGAPATFGSDTVTNYELGLKGRFLDGAVTLDTSLFDIEWEDVQLQNASPANLVFLTNGGSARSRGLETAVQWVFGEGWRVNANATFTEAELTEEIPAPTNGSSGLIGSKGTRLPFTPEFASNLGLEKSFDLPRNFRLTLGANWSHVGERNTLLRSTVAPPARRGEVLVPAYDVIDLNANLSDGDWNLAVFVRNLSSEKGIRNIDDRQGAVTTPTPPTSPRGRSGFHSLETSDRPADERGLAARLAAPLTH